MAIGAVGAAVTPFTPPSLGAAPVGGSSSGAGADKAGASSFAKSLGKVQELQDSADTLATGVATGDVTDVHQFTTAAAKASLGVELTAALRNRAVEAYQEIMRMQV